MRTGDYVRTSDGLNGRIVRPTPQLTMYKDREYRSFDLDSEAELAIYYVLIDSGELRRYRFEALSLATRLCEAIGAQARAKTTEPAPRTRHQAP